MSTAEAIPLSAAEARKLLDPLADAPALLLAISGGPDSTALLWLAARWRHARKRGPKLIAATVDHGLRPQSAREARAVADLARRLGVAHRTLRWRGAKPVTGVHEAARAARYRLLAAAASELQAPVIVTAHTLDDQAETVLFRMARGSGLAGLGAMAPLAPLPTGSGGVALARPLLDVAKARLVATLERARVSYAEDPSNRNPRFARTRIRELMRLLDREGLDARRFALLAQRLRRADAAIEVAVSAAAAALSGVSWSGPGPIRFDADQFARLPDEVALRLLGRAVAQVGSESPVELGKLETLFAAIGAALPETRHLRRTLAGAVVTLGAQELAVEQAPPRRQHQRALTTDRYAESERR